MKVTPENCFHLTADIVKEIHAAALEGFGGADGIREPSLLESAVAAPQVTIGGRSPFADLAEIAAAYLFYLCRNHPFLDGNKRAALGACLVFLRLNGVEPKPDSAKWEGLTFAIADARIDRDEATKQLRALLPKATKRKRRKG